ncbi:hypothetical protein T492DRAFT_168552 [Pavlovales sp. CCMP2436]|nr:hypothetical protein T492DRAFT_168552 [Pavlovales sp. CCMP2436]
MDPAGLGLGLLAEGEADGDDGAVDLYDDPLEIEADPLESEPESDEDDDAGLYSIEFVAKTGVRVYTAACKRLGIIPVQQFIASVESESVSLKHRGLGAVGGLALFECVAKNQCIRALDLEDNQLGLGVDPDAGGLDHMVSAIAENKLLTLLDLSFNNLSSRGCAVLSRALAPSAITELSLRGNAMGDFGAQAFAEALTLNRSITKLDLSDNGIDELGAVALAAMLTKCELMKFVDFSWNCIRLDGAAALAEALKTSSVVRLNLAWNGLGDRGAKALAEALQELLFLDISKNNLGEPAAAAVASALRVNTTLRSLQLNGNALTDKGVGQIVQAIGVNCTVRDLGLHGVALEHGGIGLFDPLNPTGRFRVDLADGFERAVLLSHLELDRQDEASGIDNFLNVRLGGKEVEFGEGKDIQDWSAPAAGVLTYDYVSGKRVPREARAQRDPVFQSYRREMANARTREFELLLHLRTACITHFFSCEQAAQLLLLCTYTLRADAAVILFRRCVDPQNFSKVWALLAPAETTALHERLGEALLPYLPEAERLKLFLTEMNSSALAKETTNPLEAELDAAWQTLAPELRAALGPEFGSGMEAQCDALRAVLWRDYVPLRAVYKFYASGEERAKDSEQLFDAGTVRMSVRELWHMLKACELTSERMPLAAIDGLFLNSVCERTLDQGTSELDLSGFLLGLIRLALAERKFALETAAEQGSEEAAGSAPSEKLALLLSQRLLLYGQREDTDAFRREFWEPLLQRKLEPFWYPLKVCPTPHIKNNNETNLPAQGASYSTHTHIYFLPFGSFLLFSSPLPSPSLLSSPLLFSSFSRSTHWRRKSRMEECCTLNCGMLVLSPPSSRNAFLVTF